jgi:hypothetical protein
MRAKTTPRRHLSPDLVSARFRSVNDREVESISLDVFYKPHTISLLIGCIVGITCIAFFR